MIIFSIYNNFIFIFSHLRLGERVPGQVLAPPDLLRPDDPADRPQGARHSQPELLLRQVRPLCAWR